MTELTFRELQAALIAAGFELPLYGPDGFWGDETASAMKRWAGSNERLMVGFPVVEPEPSGSMYTLDPLPIDDLLLPHAKMKRVINHWTAGAHKASELDRRHYHFLIEGDGKVVGGIHSVADNEVAKGNYAAHTLNSNTGSIGVAACCCAGARERPFHPGQFPFTMHQWDVMVRVNAQLCLRYGIPVSRSTVLSHCEVPKELGIAQRGKWDIAQVPFRRETWTALGDAFRDEVRKLVG